MYVNNICNNSSNCSIINHSRCFEHQKSIKKTEMENLVAQITVQNILNKEALTPMLKQVVKEYNESLKDNTTIKLLRSQKVKLRKEINNILQAIKNGAFSKHLQANLSELEEELVIIENKIKAENIKHPLADIRYLEYVFSEMRKGTKNDGMSIIIIESFIKMVSYEENEYIKIFVNIDPDNVINVDLSELNSSDSLLFPLPNKTYPNFIIKKGHLICTFKL